MKNLVLILLIVATCLSCKQESDKTFVVNLKSEYHENPLAIAEPSPRLSWNIESEERNWGQMAYQIIVASDSAGLNRGKGNIWNTGKVKSPDCQWIAYSGKPLKPLEKYWWKVKVWGRDGSESAWSKPAYWVMSLGENADWKGQWIGSDLELSELQKELKALPEVVKENENEWGWASEIRKKTGISVSEVVRESIRRLLRGVDETGSINLKI